MAARGYEFYLRVLKVSLTSERSEREDKIRIPKRPCNVLFITKECWVICLRNWNHFGYFERFGKHTSRQRSVYNGYKRLRNILERQMNYLHGYNIMSRSFVSVERFDIIGFRKRAAQEILG